MLKNIPTYYKAVVAGLGSVSTMVAALLGLGAVLPPAVSAWLTAAGAVVTTVSVYLTKNQIVTPPKV